MTPLRDHAVRVLRSSLAPLATLTILLGLAGCSDAAPEPATIEIVVPAGTQDRLLAGEEVVVMPSRIELRVGDSLVIRNEDAVDQTVGPYLVEAESETVMTYGAPGVYEGYCPLSDGERYEIVVTD